MATCYNILYNESTSAFEKHGTFITSDSGVVLHDCGYYVNTETSADNVNGLLNTSADNAVSIANVDLGIAITNAEQDTSGVPDIDFNTGDIEMKLDLTIELISPIIKVEYNPIEKILPTSLVTR